jgi:DNA polymerase I
VDWLSLLGDSVDNIPGVEGVGRKTAADLLRQFGTIENLYRRLDEVRSERVRRALAEAETEVRRNQALVRLNDQVPHAWTLERLRPRGADKAEQAQLLKQWGFKSLAPAAEAGEPQQALLL